MRYFLPLLLCISCSSADDPPIYQDASSDIATDHQLSDVQIMDAPIDIVMPICHPDASNSCSCYVQQANWEIDYLQALWSADLAEACHGVDWPCGSSDPICYNAPCSQDDWNIWISSVWHQQCVDDCASYSDCPTNCQEMCPEFDAGSDVVIDGDSAINAKGE